MTRSSYVTVTDLFCGAGGSSIGVRAAGAELKLALNHWDKAIITHNTNFPEAMHEVCDVRSADPRRYPSTDVLIASPECTAHTLAKGRPRKGMGTMDLWGKDGIDPAEERSRVTMWDVPRFAEVHQYECVIVENVVDARLYWRPFDAWLMSMAALGYDHQLVFFNSMFAHPTPQSRDRLYVVFHRSGNRKPDLQITPPAWCKACCMDVQGVQCWKNPQRPMGKYGARNQYLYHCPVCAAVVHPYYYAAATAIDWNLRGERIGDRKTPLKDKTLERIRYGLQKFCGPDYLVGLNYGGIGGRCYPVDGAYPTQTGQQDKALIQPFMAMLNNHTRARSMDRPLTTVPAEGNHHALVVPCGGTWNLESRSTDDALPTQTTRDAYGLAFLGSANHRRIRATGINEAYPTQTTDVRPFLISHYGGRHATHSADDALMTQPGRDIHGLVCPPLMLGQQSGATARPVNQEMPTVATGGAISLLVPYNGTGVARTTNEPHFTVSTHDREALVETSGLPAVEDCSFRMLKPHEIQAAMAFPADYQVLGTERDKVKQLGNAVTPPVLEILFRRCAATLAG